MFKRFTYIKPAMLLLSFALIAGLGFTASAQKHGNKNGNGHGNGGEKQGGGEARDRDNENGRREGQRRVERQQTSQAVFGNPAPMAASARSLLPEVLLGSEVRICSATVSASSGFFLRVS